MKEINTASTALLIAERELVKGLDRVNDYAKCCTGEMYGTLSRSIKNIAKTNDIELAPVDRCYQCDSDIEEPYMISKVFCCREHMEEYQQDEDCIDQMMAVDLLPDDDKTVQNAVMRIALHKLQSMTLPHEASKVVNEALISLARDYGTC